MLPLNLYARVRTSLCSLHTRPRVQRAPGLPCALLTLRVRTKLQNSGALRRENAESHLQRSLKLKCRLSPSLRANGSRECAPDDRLREAIHRAAQRKNGLLPPSLGELRRTSRCARNEGRAEAD